MGFNSGFKGLSDEFWRSALKAVWCFTLLIREAFPAFFSYRWRNNSSSVRNALIRRVERTACRASFPRSRHTVNWLLLRNWFMSAAISMRSCTLIVLSTGLLFCFLCTVHITFAYEPPACSQCHYLAREAVYLRTKLWDAFASPLLSWKSNRYYIFCVCVCSLKRPLDDWVLLSSILFCSWLRTSKAAEWYWRCLCGHCFSRVLQKGRESWLDQRAV